MLYIFIKEYYVIYGGPQVKKLAISLVILGILSFYGCDRVPEFLSDPVTDAYENSEYVYTVQARDPDGKAITYSLIDPPAGMFMKDNVITWTPTQAQVGDYAIRVKAEDTTKFAYQDFTLTVHYRTQGYAKYFNLTDENFYNYGGATVKCIGNNFEQTTTTDGSGWFGIDDTSPGIYEYHFLTQGGKAWTIGSSARNVNLYAVGRNTNGTARLRVTVLTALSGGKYIQLVGNNQSVYLPEATSAHTFTKLFPFNYETIFISQWTSTSKVSFGKSIVTQFPVTYGYVRNVELVNGQTTTYNFNITWEDSWAKVIPARISQGAYLQERFGKVHIPNTTHHMNISRYIDITNVGGMSTPMNASYQDINTYVSHGQNHEQITEWFGNSGWAPYISINRSENVMDLVPALSYPRNPVVSGGSTMVDFVPDTLQKGEMPGMPTLMAKSPIPVARDAGEMRVQVTTGVGTSPHFSWAKPVFKGYDPEVYVPMVFEVNSNNQYVKTVWTGVTTRNSIDFPEFDTPLLQTGKRYVFLVAAYAAYQARMTQDTVLWYPESEIFFMSRSEGALFEP